MNNKDIVRVKGKEKTVDLYNLDNKKIIIKGTILKIAQLKNEYFDKIDNPQDILRAMAADKIKADLFTFWQRLPDIEPKYKYHHEGESLAVLKIENYDNWFKHTIDSKTRNIIRKSGKIGVFIDTVDFNDDFVKGIVNIYKETPIRQGKPFWHYEKDFSQIKEETSDALEKSVFIGAYYNGEMIGFLKMLMADQYAMIVLILSMIAHRDKSTQNSLIAKAVEVCCGKNIKYIIYAKWDVNKTLADFKKRNGFNSIVLPRYYIPLTIKGYMALKLNLHHGIIPFVPAKIKHLLNEVRVKYVIRKYKPY